MENASRPFARLCYGSLDPQKCYCIFPSRICNRSLERINCIPCRIVQLQPPPRPILIQHLQAILLRIIQAPSAPASTPQPDLALASRALDPEADIDPAMHLVDLALDPWILAGKVDLVAELLAHQRIRPQRVQRTSHDGRLGLLVVEEGEERDDHGGDEEWERIADLTWYEGRDAT